MVTYEMSVERQRIYGADKFAVAANANETISFRFHFDRNWRIFDSKAAIFRNSDGCYYILEIKNDRVTVPWEVMTKSKPFEFSVIGFENETVITSAKVMISVSESLLPEDYVTFSPTQTLFDKFKQECTAKAFLEYEDEIRKLKSDCEERIFKLNAEKEKEKEESEAALDDKNRELADEQAKHRDEIFRQTQTLEKVRTELEKAKKDADNWALINKAISLKTVCNASLWGSASDKFALPLMDTSSISVFTASSFSSNLTEIGLDLISVKKFEQIFMNHTGIRKIKLINTQNVTNFNGAFEGASAVKEVSIGDLDSCISLYHLVSAASCLEKLTLGTTSLVTNYDYMCKDCIALKSIDCLLDMSAVTSCSGMFGNCVSLEDVRFKENSVKKSIDLRHSINLTKESMLSLIYSLNDKAGCSLYISRLAFERLFPTMKEQDEMYEVIMDVKGWAVGLY